MDSTYDKLYKINKKYNKAYDLDYKGEIIIININYATSEDLKNQIKARQIEIEKQELELDNYKKQWQIKENMRLKTNCCYHNFDFNDICICKTTLLFNYNYNFKNKVIFICQYCYNEFCGCMDY